MRADKEFKIGKTGNRWLHIGFSFRQFAVGLRFNSRSFDLDIAFFWIGFEW